MTSQRILATYRIETASPLEQAAAAMAGEQSTGTFVRVPGETEALRDRFGARVERITGLETLESPSLPGSRPPRRADGTIRYRRAEVVLSFPLENMGPSLPNLVATVAGNLFELREFSGLKLIDLDLPPAFAEAYPGPQFGVRGTRALAGVEGRPIIGTIIKPSVGLSPEETAALVKTLVEAGLDFIKDDELMANPPHSPLAHRVEAVMRVVNAHAERTGKKVMVAFNITDEIDAMLRHHDTVLAAGGTCVMVSLNSVGLPGVAYLRRHGQLPIHGHRNGWGMLARHPYLGMEFAAYSKLWRLAGVDHLHTNGLRNKFCETDESVVASARACLAPLLGGYEVMPVLSSGQWAGQVPETLERVGSVDLMYLCGGGIMAHPGGPAAGVASIRQAWEAALAGTPLAEYASDHIELRQALERFGP
jgi:ribulose-bisphosphate carboxylase large chain